MSDYTELEGPTGNFAKFNEVGDFVEGTIVSFTLDQGTDFNGAPCPQIVIDADGEMVTVTAGQANLKAKILANSASFVAGAAIKILYASDEKTKNDRTVKQFKVGIGAAPKPQLAEL